MKRPRLKSLAVAGMAAITLLTGGLNGVAEEKAPRFRALVLTERGGLHEPYVAAAMEWIAALAKAENFAFDVHQHTDVIDEAFLARYAVFIQLNYPPYTWSDTSAAAFRKYIEEGKGGWVGFHHATLLGEFDGYPLWNWFSDFMGGIRFKGYIADLAEGKVTVEDRKHPVMNGVPASFTVTKEEWYTYDRSPRPNVHVLASVDEASYNPMYDIKMGDHPVVWTNENMKARNVYVFMGHHPDLLKNTAYTTLFRNAILWAAGTSE